VKISGVSLDAIQRSAGLSSSLPPRMIAAIVPTTLAAPSQPPPALPAAPAVAARNGMSARIGIAAMSWSSFTRRLGVYIFAEEFLADSSRRKNLVGHLSPCKHRPAFGTASGRWPVRTGK